MQSVPNIRGKESVNIKMSELLELRRDIAEIKESLAEIKITIAENKISGHYAAQKVEGVTKEVDELKKKVAEINDKQRSNDWIGKLIYGLISAIVIGSIVATVLDK